MWTQVSFVFSQSTRLTDGQTDGRKGVCNTVRCIKCSRTVKTSSPRAMTLSWQDSYKKDDL